VLVAILGGPMGPVRIAPLLLSPRAPHYRKLGACAENRHAEACRHFKEVRSSPNFAQCLNAENDAGRTSMDRAP
jgi:hypothetical protein